MTTFYTTEQIDEQAGVIGRYLKTVSTDLTEYIDTSVLSAESSVSPAPDFPSLCFASYFNLSNNNV